MELGDGIKNVILASIGAAALTVEKSSEVVDTLVKKGELTVEQGKAVNQELKHKAEEAKVEKKETSVEELVKGLSAEDKEKLKKLLETPEEEKKAE